MRSTDGVKRCLLETNKIWYAMGTRPLGAAAEAAATEPDGCGKQMACFLVMVVLCYRLLGAGYCGGGAIVPASLLSLCPGRDIMVQLLISGSAFDFWVDDFGEFETAEPHCKVQYGAEHTT